MSWCTCTWLRLEILELSQLPWLFAIVKLFSCWRLFKTFSQVSLIQSTTIPLTASNSSHSATSWMEASSFTHLLCSLGTLSYPVRLRKNNRLSEICFCSKCLEYRVWAHQSSFLRNRCSTSSKAATKTGIETTKSLTTAQFSRSWTLSRWLCWRWLLRTCWVFFGIAFQTIGSAKFTMMMRWLTGLSQMDSRDPLMSGIWLNQLHASADLYLVCIIHLRRFQQ